MKTMVVCLATVAMALAVPSPARSQATTPTAPRDPSLRTFVSDLAGDVRRLPSNPAGISIATGSILSAMSRSHVSVQFSRR